MAFASASARQRVTLLDDRVKAAAGPSRSGDAHMAPWRLTPPMTGTTGTRSGSPRFGTSTAAACGSVQRLVDAPEAIGL